MDIGIYSSEGYFETGTDLNLDRNFVTSCDGVWWRITPKEEYTIVSGFFWVIKPDTEGRWERVVACSIIPNNINSDLPETLLEYFKSVKTTLERYNYENKCSIENIITRKDISGSIIHNLILNKRKNLDIKVSVDKSVKITDFASEPPVSEKISYGYYVNELFKEFKDFLIKNSIELAFSSMKLSKNAVCFNEQTGMSIDSIGNESYYSILKKYKNEIIKESSKNFENTDKVVLAYWVKELISKRTFENELKDRKGFPDDLVKICTGIKKGIELSLFKNNFGDFKNISNLLYALKSKKLDKYSQGGLKAACYVGNQDVNKEKRKKILKKIFDMKIWDISVERKAKKKVSDRTLLNNIKKDTDVWPDIKNWINENLKYIILAFAVIVLIIILILFKEQIMDFIYRILDLITNTIKGIVETIKNLIGLGSDNVDRLSTSNINTTVNMSDINTTVNISE